MNSRRVFSANMIRIPTMFRAITVFLLSNTILKDTYGPKLRTVMTPVPIPHPPDSEPNPLTGGPQIPRMSHNTGKGRLPTLVRALVVAPGSGTSREVIPLRVGARSTGCTNILDAGYGSVGIPGRCTRVTRTVGCWELLSI